MRYDPDFTQFYLFDTVELISYLIRVQSQRIMDVRLDEEHILAYFIVLIFKQLLTCKKEYPRIAIP